MRAIGRIVVTLMVIACTARGEEGDASKQLRRECDALIARAVKRPYGWAWAEAVPEAKPKGGAQGVTMRPTGSAAAGLVLYWAGELLDEPRYKEAAYQAARGMVAAERPDGRVPARPMFLPNVAGGREEPALVADRAPTCAAEALLLTIEEDAGAKDAVIHGAAMRGVNWLLKQQAVNGAWPQAHAAATQPSDVVRLLRLDDVEWRNCVFTMLLAREVLNDERCARSVERSNDLLLRMRIGDVSTTGAPLWATSYGMDAFVTNRLADFPPGVDTLATRRAMETLLATVLVQGNPEHADEGKPTPGQGLGEAAIAIAKLPKFDGGWLRLYGYDVEATPAPPPKEPVGFNTVAPVRLPRQQTGDWGLKALVDDTAVLKESGRAGLMQKMSVALPVHQRLAAVVSGLQENAFELKPDAQMPDGSSPEELAGRLNHLWQVFQRARAERTK